jgi:hypothetical protein
MFLKACVLGLEEALVVVLSSAVVGLKRRADVSSVLLKSVEVGADMYICRFAAGAGEGCM